MKQESMSKTTKKNQKKPKPLLFLVIIEIVALFFVTGCMFSTAIDVGRETATVVYPLEGSDYIFDVPLTWAEDMEEVDGEKRFLVAEKRNDIGHVFAGTKIVSVEGFSDISETEPAIGEFLASEKKRLGGDAEEVAFTKNTAANIKKDIRTFYEASFVAGDKQWNYAFCVDKNVYKSDDDSRNDIYVFCMWAEDSRAGSAKLVDILYTLRHMQYIEDMDMLSVDSIFRELIDNRSVDEKIQDMNADASELFATFLRVQRSLDNGIENSFGEYRILSIREVGMHGFDIGEEALDGAFIKDHRWDLIYPSVHVYEVDFQTRAGYKNFVSVFVPCENVIVEENGLAKFEKAYMVVAENTYLAEVGTPNKICLLGFLNQEAIHAAKASRIMAESEDLGEDMTNLGNAEYAVLSEEGETRVDIEAFDREVLSLADAWYDEEVFSIVKDKYSTEYIGNHVQTGNLVARLPMFERIDFSEGTFTDKSIIMQTSKEPYGLTINYYFDEPLYNSSALLSSGKLTAQDYINDSIEDAINKNAERLFEGIGNLGELKINLYYANTSDKDEDYSKVTFDFTKK